MRYAIVSDIHSNLQAWNAVLLDIRTLGAEKIICLGDIVGYGPNPAQVLESVYANVDHFVLGNHDAALCGKLDDSLFTDAARDILAWTRRRVGRNALQFLSNLPLSLDGEVFRCTHGEFSEPGYFNYVIEPGEAMASWEAASEQLLFIGHTHVPAIFLLGRSGTPHLVEPQDFELEEHKRYLVNVGSVGQPRDGETRASYCVYDRDAGTVCWRRIPFDIDAYRDAVAAAGIPVAASYFLQHDPRTGVPPLRELLSFSPAQTSDMAARDVEEVHTLEVLQKRVRKWRLLFWAAILALVLVAAAGSWALTRRGKHARVIADPAIASVVDAAQVPQGSNMVAISAAPAGAGSVIPGWTVYLGNERTQSAAVELSTDDKAPCLVLTSSSIDQEIRLCSAAFAVGPRMKFHMEALFKQSGDFDGDVWIGMELTRKTAVGRRTNLVFPTAPAAARKGGWKSAKVSFTLPADAETARFQVHGRFTGEIRVKDVRLNRGQSQGAKEQN